MDAFCKAVAHAPLQAVRDLVHASPARDAGQLSKRCELVTRTLLMEAWDAGADVCVNPRATHASALAEIWAHLRPEHCAYFMQRQMKKKTARDDHGDEEDDARPLQRQRRVAEDDDERGMKRHADELTDDDDGAVACVKKARYPLHATAQIAIPHAPRDLLIPAAFLSPSEMPSELALAVSRGLPLKTLRDIIKEETYDPTERERWSLAIRRAVYVRDVPLRAMSSSKDTIATLDELMREQDVSRLQALYGHALEVSARAMGAIVHRMCFEEEGAAVVTLFSHANDDTAAPLLRFHAVNQRIVTSVVPEWRDSLTPRVLERIEEGATETAVIYNVLTTMTAHACIFNAKNGHMFGLETALLWV